MLVNARYVLVHLVTTKAHAVGALELAQIHARPHRRRPAKRAAQLVHSAHDGTCCAAAAKGANRRQQVQEKAEQILRSASKAHTKHL